MKKIYLFALVAMLFASCTTDATQDATVGIETPEILTVSFEEISRIQLQDEKTVWTAGDLVSVFYRSNGNQKWQFQGETGERNGMLKRVANAEATQELSDIVVVYPYNENYYINPRTCNVQASLPATQNYLADSYGLNGNIMISQSEYNQIALKSVCGWLKLQLTGNGEVVKSITLKGNNGEQVAGQIYINSADATCTLAAENGASGDDNVAGGNLVFDDTILTEVTLDCGEGVTLGAEVTAFYIALPPQTFENGLTVTFTNADGVTFEKSTDNAVVIERNAIQPMTAFGAEFPKFGPANNEIWYTNGSTTVATTPYKTDVFGASIVSNTYDAEKECWVIKFDGEVTSIGKEAFRNCTSLTSVTIGNSVTSIGNSAFEGCNGVTEWYIPNNISSLGDRAFSYCVGKMTVDCNIPTKRYVDDDDRYPAFYYSLITELVVGDQVSTLGTNAFRYCPKLTDVTISNSVVSIGDYAFTDCDSLENIVIGDNVTSIGSYAFFRCSSLKSVTIPNSISTIGESAFSYCTSLEDVTLPNNTSLPGAHIFEGCTSLKAFYGAYASLDNRCWVINGVLVAFAPAGLTSYTIPSEVTAIESYAFYRCTTLKSIKIPTNITSIGWAAFNYCSSLRTVYCMPTTPPIGNYYMFDSNASERKIYVPTASVEAYKSASYWSNYKSYIEGYNF